MFRSSNREFQAGLNQEQTRRHRQDQSLSLRRKKRELNLQNKRQRILNSNNLPTNLSKSETESSLLRNLPRFVEGIFTNNKATIYECIRNVRRLLAFQSSPPIKLVIDSGIIDRVISFLDWSHSPNIQFEAAWILTNIASSNVTEYTAKIISNGLIHSLLKLLKAPNYSLREQSLWCLGNIAGESKQMRNLLLTNNILSHILSICKEGFNADYDTNYAQLQSELASNTKKSIGIYAQFQSMLEVLTWTLSNLCRFAINNEEKTRHLLECLGFSFKRAEEIEDAKHNGRIFANIAWSFKYILAKIDWDEHNIPTADMMHKMGLTKQLIGLFYSNRAEIKQAVMKAVGDIITATNDIYTQQCIDNGLLNALYHLLTEKEKNENFLKEILWTISNITAGTKQQIIAVIKANIFPFLMEIIKNGKKNYAAEALWACSNATAYKAENIEIVKYLVETGLIECLCEFLNRMKLGNEHLNDKTQIVALECIENILICDDWNHHTFAIQFESEGGCDYLEYLQSEENVNETIYDKVVSIVERFFSDDDEIELIGGHRGGDGSGGFGVKVQDNQFVFSVDDGITQQTFSF